MGLLQSCRPTASTYLSLIFLLSQLIFPVFVVLCMMHGNGRIRIRTRPHGAFIISSVSTRDVTIQNDNDFDNDSNNNKLVLDIDRLQKETRIHTLDSLRRQLLQGIFTAATPGVVLSSSASPASAASVNSAAASSSSLPSKSHPKFVVPTPPWNPQMSWPLGKVAFSLLPLAGTYTRRATLQEEIVPDTIWTHDQIQGVVNVNVPVRQTVVRLSDQAGGGLWVHNPVAPTPQLLSMMHTLIHQYGPVQHIVLGSVALEHKATFGPFASHFPNATVWLQPGQWAFPVALPIEFYGLVQRGRRLQEIPIDVVDSENSEDSSLSPPRRYRPRKYPYYARDPEWRCDVDFEVLGPLQFQSVGAFSETAFFHTSTRTLILTDTVLSVTRDPPPIVREDPRALVFHARDSVHDTFNNHHRRFPPSSHMTIQDKENIDPEILRKGWRRMVQFGLVFFPSHITVTSSAVQAWNEARQFVPHNYTNLGDGAIPGTIVYPWTWDANNADVASFAAMSQHGTLFCPPILTKLILDREPRRTLDWVDRVSTRFAAMQRIIPSHLNNNIAVRGSREFYRAFDPLRSSTVVQQQTSSSSSVIVYPQRALAEDLALLQRASDVLTQYGIVAPSQVCDGELARRHGRFATLSADVSSS